MNPCRALRRFLPDVRAGATAFVAVAVSIMAVCGVALIGDHSWLVKQRDILKTAADAAAVAATLELGRLPSTMSDSDVDQELMAVAERYILLNMLPNLPQGARERARDTLEVEIDVNRAAGLVGVVARADLGGTLFAARFFDYAGPEGGMEQRAGVEAAGTATEIVLAVDVTSSMFSDPAGRYYTDPAFTESRMDIVKRAAIDLIDVMASGASGMPLAVGIAPWHYRVRLAAAERQRWDDNGWAVYGSDRTYPYAWWESGAGRQAATETVPAQSGSWTGCVDWRDTASAAVLDLPDDDPFAMTWYSPEVAYPDTDSVGYECRADAGPPEVQQQYCYWLPPGSLAQPSGSVLPAQDPCRSDMPTIMPLSDDLNAVRASINALRSGGASTYSALGVEWGTRLMVPEWRAMWSDDSPYPMESTPGREVRKILVLLTDGEDNHHSQQVVYDRRRNACDAAKAAGITIFTIAAMDTSGSRYSFFRSELERCSSAADDPDGTYVYVNNATPEAIAAAFADISRQLLVMRRVY